MSKAFTKESDDGPDEELDSSSWADLPLNAKNYLTPHGHRRLVDERDYLANHKRPELSAQIAAAAVKGTTSENLEYHLPKKRLREVERRFHYLSKRLENAEVIDPLRRGKTDQIFFGATVKYAGKRSGQRTVSIVGVDEIDIANGRLSFVSPLARALLKAHEGDVVTFHSPAGAEDLEVLSVEYREIPVAPFRGE